MPCLFFFAIPGKEGPISKYLPLVKSGVVRSEEMAHQLRALFALPGDPGSVPRTHVQLWHLQVPGMHVDTAIHTGKTPIHFE